MARRILLAATYRDDEPLVDRASSLLDQIRRAGAIELALGPLAHRDIEPLIVSRLGGSSLQPELAQRVYERGGGNPLFCLEIARAALDDGSVRIVDGRWRLVSDRLPEQLPVSVRELVARRTAALPVDVRELLKVSAEMGSDAAYETLEAVAMGGERSLLQALDLALASGLLVERGPRYAFAHPLYRLAVRTATGSRQRGRIHLAVALALAGGAAVDAQPPELEAAAAACPDASAVADHALAAVELGLTAALPLAVAFGFEAGARARRLLDFDHARTVLDGTFKAHRRMPAPLRERFATGRALLNLGGLQMVANDETAAARSYRAAIAAARTPDEAAEAYSAAGWLPYRHGDFDGALAILEEGLAAIPPDAAVARGQLEVDIGWCLVRLGRLPEARRLLEGATTVLERSRALPHAMKALDYLGDTLGMLGDTQGAVGRLERSLALAREIQDSHGELVARLHLGLTLTAAGRYVLARPHVERALDLAHVVGDRYIEAVAALSGAVMEDHEGNIPAARAYRRRELALLVAIGGNALHEAASHAHLASLARRSGDAASAEREAIEARRLARQCEMRGYEEAIERSLTADPWPLQPR